MTLCGSSRLTRTIHGSKRGVHGPHYGLLTKDVAAGCQTFSLHTTKTEAVSNSIRPVSFVLQYHNSVASDWLKYIEEHSRERKIRFPDLEWPLQFDKFTTNQSGVDTLHATGIKQVIVKKDPKQWGVAPLSGYS